MIGKGPGQYFSPIAIAKECHCVGWPEGERFGRGGQANTSGWSSREGIGSGLAGTRMNPHLMVIWNSTRTAVVVATE